MLTSIRALRDSSAMQSRVSQVANNLKRLNPNWKDEWFFPIVAVGLSNVSDDVEWVENTPSVLLKSSPQHIFAIGVGTSVTATALNGAVKKHYPAQLSSNGKTETVNKSLDAVNAELSVLFGRSVDWKNGLTLEAQADAPGAQPTALPASAPASDATPKSAEQAAAVSPEVEAKIEAKARALFEAAFPDADNSTSTNARTGVIRYANDRTQGKFVGFYAALKAVNAGTIKLGELFPLN